MRFADAAARLVELPETLPPRPPELTAVVVPPADGRVPRLPRWPTGPRREAAVLVLVHPGAGDDQAAYVLLTARATGGHRHAGQISFPGGAVDPDDESVVAAALREAAEETGLDVRQAGVRVIGTLAPVDVRVSGFVVHPVVALSERAPATVADGHEVAEVFSAPLAAFLPGAPIETITAERDGVRLRYGAYVVNGHEIWGATGGMLGGLGAFLGRSQATPR